MSVSSFRGEQPSVPLFAGRTADDAWLAAATQFASGRGGAQGSRAGNTRELLHAVFAIGEPRQRWVAARQPAINPAFAIAETLWLILGRDEAAFPNYWNPKLPSYSGQTRTYRGAYGKRLRKSWGLDQLRRAAQALGRVPESRQVVLQIWHPAEDLPLADGAPRRQDVPCNICSLLKVRGGRLEWTQVLLSNDLFLGVPHNFVQFTTLQEIVAGWLGLGLGQYTHFSDSLHVYDSDLPALKKLGVGHGVANEDSLALPWKDSNKVLASLWRRAAPLALAALTQTRFTRLLAECDLPAPYENLLLILAADSARRRRWPDLTAEAVRRCSNQALRQLWESWRARQSVALASD